MRKKIIFFLFLFSILSITLSCKNKEKEYVFIYYSNMEENIDAEKVLESELETKELPQAKKEGHTFVGWYLDESLETEYDSKIILEDKVVYLYAKYILNDYKLLLHNEDQVVNSIYKYGENIELPIFERDGYYIEGWYLDSEYQTRYEYKTMPAKDLDVYVRWEKKPEFQVNISMNIPGSVTIYGNTNQVVSEEAAFEEVWIEENLGYRFLYYIIDEKTYANNVIDLTSVDSDIEILIVSDYFTFELPIININTFGYSIDSKMNYTDMSFSISNCNDELTDISGGIRLRGNSTRLAPKKPYRIKFDKKQSLFGLTKAKSWVLLAEYLDPSGLHNYTALSLGGKMDGLAFTPTPNKVNVYLNGEYIGLYTLCEQVQENEGRIGIEIDITEDMKHLKDYNFFISMDKSTIEDEDAVLDETYYYISEYDKYFELKYPEKDNFLSEDQFLAFMNELKVYTKYLLDIFSQRDEELIKNEVNLFSLADFLIVDEIMGESDHSYKSFNMYYTNTSNNLEENGKINFGPIWDYDWCLYTPWTAAPNESFEKERMRIISYSNDFFKAMIDIPEFLDIVKGRYTNGVVDKLAKLIENLEIYQFTILDSILLNESKWYSDKKDLSIKNILYLNQFLRTRQYILDDLWKLE